MTPDQLKKLEQEVAEAEAKFLAARDPNKKAVTQPTGSDNPTGGDEANAAAPSDRSDTGESVAQGQPEQGGAPEAGDDAVAINARWESRYKNLQSKMTKASQEAAELRRERAETMARIESLEKALSEQRDTQRDTASSLDQLVEDYPDIMRPLLAHLSKLEGRLNDMSNSSDAARKQAAAEAHRAKIAEVHPDFDALVQDEDFDGWLNRQSPVWLRVASEGTADEVIELLSRYKQEAGLAPAKAGPKTTGTDKARAVAEPRLPRGRDPQSGSKRIWTRQEIQAMSIAEYAKLETEIDRAFAEGRVRG